MADSLKVQVLNHITQYGGCHVWDFPYAPASVRLAIQHLRQQGYNISTAVKGWYSYTAAVQTFTESNTDAAV